MRGLTQTALALVALAACVLAVGISAASFTDTEQNPQTVSAVADFLPPTASASVIGKTQGGVAGYIKEGGTYYVYANVTDPGSSPSGIASVKANVSTITTGQTAATLSAGSYSLGGIAYNYRSAQLTAKSGLSAGSKSYTLAFVDSAGHSESQSFSVTVDNGPFKGNDFETANVSGGTEGKPEKGDSVSFEFNDAPDPNSIVSGWDGSGTKSVTISITNNSENDSLGISGATVGSVAMKGDFTASTATFSGSSMSLSGSTLTIVLGAASGSVLTETDKSKAAWTPSASNYDAAGNACATTVVNGSNKKQF